MRSSPSLGAEVASIKRIVMRALAVDPKDRYPDADEVRRAIEALGHQLEGRRALATHALSIFGDHSDVMAVRATGFAMLASSSVQEAHDMALIAQAATLRARVPFVHFFDGFRTSHEVNTLRLIPDETIRAMVNDDLVRAHRARALSPDNPVVRGTAQNPDVFFQGREAGNPFHAAVPAIVADWAVAALAMPKSTILTPPS